MADPLTVQQARERLGLASTHRDAEIQDLLDAAIEKVERLSGHILVRRTVTLEFASFPAATAQFRIDRFPVRGLTSVSYLDLEGVEQTLVGARLVGGAVRAPRLYPAVGETWPSGGDAIYVVLDAGYDAAEGEGLIPYPDLLVQAVIALVGAWFEDHEGKRNVPAQVLNICGGFRRKL